MQQPEERWQRLVDRVGLANATRLIMAENPGQGDSVNELDSIWEDMGVFQIHEAILAEESLRPAVPETIGLWGATRAGANVFNIPMPSLFAASPTVTCNSWLQL